MGGMLYLYLTHSVSVISKNIAISDILSKTGFFGLHFCREHYGSKSTNVINCPFVSKATEFGEVTQNNGHYAVQGHSRSPISVPIGSPYATSVNNNLHNYLAPFARNNNNNNNNTTFV